MEQRVEKTSLGRQKEKQRQLFLKDAAFVAAEALERRCLLSGVDGSFSATQAEILAAASPRMHEQFVGSALELSPISNAQVATPDYALLDPNPSLASTDALAPFSSSSPYGLSPSQIRTAYGINNIKFGSVTGDGTGQTIAIIDAYDDPNAVSDLHAFDQEFGLPDPPSFTKVNEYGGSTLPGTDPAGAGNDDWEIEESLDIEWTHAIAPAANIILVEANSPDDADLITNAVGWARSAQGVSAVSMSFGEAEYSGETSLDSVFTTPAGHTGVTFLASTGDDGSPGGYPAYSANVVAVGGTTLNVDNAGDYLSESGWSGSGGGISAYESQPSYQQGVVTQSTTSRTIPDVAFDADPNTGVAVYDSYDYGSTDPWIQVGGTSLSAPSWAGLIAIADQGRVLNGSTPLDGATQTLPLLYGANASEFNDITSGSNGAFSAGLGYDLVTGRGSPVAQELIPHLAAAGPYVSSYSPTGLQSSAPSYFDFNFSTAMDPTSFSVTTDVDAFTGPGDTDLRSSINGFSWLNGNTTLQVDFIAPESQGPYTMTIGPQILSAGGIPMDQNQNGTSGEIPADEFSGTFYYDVSPTDVASTNPASGSTVTLPFTTLDLDFSAPIDPTTVSTSNLTLSEGTVTAATFVNATTVQYTIGGSLNGGTLTVSMAQGALLDANENPVLAFTGSYILPVQAAPGAPALLAISDSGVSDSDDITDFDNSSPAKALQFSVPGTIPGDIVSIYADGALIGSATANSTTTDVVTNGTTALSNGVHSITAEQSDYGAQSTPSAGLSVTILTTPPSLPAAGGLDTSFNGTGVLTQSQFTGYGAQTVVVQPDGKLVVGGSMTLAGSTTTSATVARYLSNGSLDSTFGTGGYVTIRSTGGDQIVRSLALQSDGKIVALITPAVNIDYAPLEVARFNSNGTLDSTFGSEGIVTLSPGNITIAAGSIVVQSNGDLLIAGSGSDSHGELIRLTATGSLDSTFNGTGYVLSYFGATTSFNDAVVASDGSVIAVGETPPPSGGSFNVVVARYTTSGALDTTFNNSGYVITTVGTSFSNAEGVALQTDGKIVVSAVLGSGVGLIRYNISGTLDSGFGSGGIVTIANANWALAPVIQPDGKILLDGSYYNLGKNEAFVDRLNPNGSPDSSFGNSGQVLAQIGPSNEHNEFFSLALQSDGQIVAVGLSSLTSSGTSIWTVARFLGSSPALALDPSSDSGISDSDDITNVTTPTFDVPNVSGLYTRIYANGVLVSSPYANGATVTVQPQAPGVYQYTMTVVDAAGNESPASSPITVTIDTTPPTATLSSNDTLLAALPAYSFTMAYTDNNAVAGSTLGSGNILVTAPDGYSEFATLESVTPSGNAGSITATYQITPDSSGWGPAGTIYTFTLEPNSVTDVAGNPAASGSLGTVAVVLAGTTLSLTPVGNPNPSNATQTLTFTATVGGGVPDGETVTLQDASNNNAVLASGTLSGGSATLTIPAGILSAGTHNLIAVYGGDANFAASESAPYIQTILPVVTGISPFSGPADGGMTITIIGAGFTGATAVDFGSTPATSFTVNSTGTQITAVDPAGTSGTTVDVTVVTPGGTTATSAADEFTYLPSWLAAGSAATWNASTDTLTVTGAATIIADPGSDEPNVVASGSAAVVTIAPTIGDVDIHIGGVTLTDGASIVMSDVDASQVADGTNAANHHSDHNVLVIGTLGATSDPTISIDSASKLDLGDNDLIVHTGSSDAGTDDVQRFPETNELKAIEALAAEGRNVAPGGVYDGTWAGNGLTSSAAATADDSANAGYEQNILAVEQNSDMYLGGYTKWTVGSASETLGANDIIVKYTYNGDLNLDGAVDGNAATIFSTFYDGGATSGNTYAYGDLNGDGKIDGNDATIFSTVYGNGLAASGLPQL